jgi:hypothetical protein
VSTSIAAGRGVNKLRTLRAPLLVVLATVLATALAAVPALAQSSQWGSRGISHDFTLAGTRLYAAEGRGVGVYDVASMKRLETATRDDETLAVALAGPDTLASMTSGGIDLWSIAANGKLTLTSMIGYRGFTHLAANGGTVAAATASGVNIYSINNGSTLERTGTIPVSATINDLAFAGDRLYIAIEGIGIEIVDPDAAEEATILPEAAKGLAVNGDYLYVAAGGNGLVTVSLDGAPHVVNRTGEAEANLTRVVAAGTRVYAVAQGHLISVFDASTPATPVLKTTLDEPALAIAAAGSSLYVSGARLDGNGLATDNGVPLRVFDVGQAAAPRKVAEVSEPDGAITGVALSPNGSIAYVIDRPFLRVLDVSHSAAPREMASLQLDNIQDQVRINSDGTRLILYSRGDAQLIDIRDPYKPRFLNVWHSLGRPPSKAGFLHDYVLEANWNTGFHVLDFDHYDPPAQIGGMKMDYHELAIKANADVAYLSPERIAVAPMDLSNPHQPYNPRVLFMWMKEGVFADANDTHADLLLARTPEGVRVLDLADPLTPVEVSSVAMPDAIAMAAAGQTAYVAASGAIVRMDLTNAADPVLSGSDMRVTAPQQMAAVGGKLVVADTYSLRVFGPDTAPPAPPIPSRRRAVKP